MALLVADGLPTSVIARRLGLSPRTVAHYVRYACQRLDLADRQALAAWVNARRNPELGLRRGDVDTPA